MRDTNFASELFSATWVRYLAARKLFAENSLSMYSRMARLRTTYLANTSYRQLRDVVSVKRACRAS